jgi:hypothetical protein
MEHQPRIGTMTKDEGDAPPIIHARFAIDGDMLNVPQGDTALAQTIVDRLRGQTGPMFDSAKPFFLGRRDQLPVPDKAGSGVAVISV